MSPQLLLLRRLAAHRCGGHGSHRSLSSAAGGGPPHFGGERGRVQGQHVEESKAVKVSVWWDFENCHVPTSVNACRIAPRVSAALRAAGVRGPLSITAFGDVARLSRASQEALLSTGVAISHVPNSGKNSSDRSFMADLVYWIAQNPPPAHFFLISGDKDFANILHRLRMSNYNILLACPSSATSVLCSAATIMWPWEALVKGEDFSPKRFNQPPDGLYVSWYGHHKGDLDDPFLESESAATIVTPVSSDSKHCTIPRTEANPIPKTEANPIPKTEANPIPKTESNPIPKTAVNTIPRNTINGIRTTLYSHPNGVSLGELRAELKTNNVFLGKEFFGHKKFSCLLRSMPNIVRFVGPLPGEDQPYVVGVSTQSPEPTEQSDEAPPSSVSTSFSEHDSKALSSSQEVVGDGIITQTVNQNPPAFAISSSEVQKEHPRAGTNAHPESPAFAISSSEVWKEHPRAGTSAHPESPANPKDADVGNAPGTPFSSVLENTVNSDGLLKRIWVLWNGPETVNSEVSPHHESTSPEVVNGLQTPRQDQNTDQRSIHETSPRNGNSDGTDSTAAARTAIFSALSHNDRSEKQGYSKNVGKLKSGTSVLQNLKPCSESASGPMGDAGKGDSSEMSKGLLSLLTGLLKFGNSEADSSTANKKVTNKATGDSIEELESLNASTCESEQQVGHTIFTKFYFWDVLDQHLSKPLGSGLVAKAKTREELVLALQNLDCWALKGLVEKDFNHLVYLLVSEKKWIEETPSTSFPFRLTLRPKRTCAPSNSSRVGSLSSLFSEGKTVQQGNYVGDKGKEDRTLTREEILSDCHKMLKDLLLQYKYGFNISIFMRHFSQKHGYKLDHQKLGYSDLESLLQIMPDIIIKYPRILPAENKGGQADIKGNGNQGIGDDLVWEELGPVSGNTETAQGADKEKCYRPPTDSEDEFSDNDNQADQLPKRETQQSSLLQIIDSWSSSKDDGSGKRPQDIDWLVGCSRSSPAQVDTLKTARPPNKQYNFVSESSASESEDQESVSGKLKKAQG